MFRYNVHCSFGIGFLKKDEMEWALLNASINTFELGQAPKKFRSWETGNLELIWLKLKCTFCSQRAYRQKRQYLLDRNGALTAISKLLIYKGQTAAERYHLKLCVIEMLNLNVTLMWNRFQETILRLDLILKAWHSQTKKSGKCDYLTEILWENKIFHLKVFFIPV